ncbi:MAG: hypothetical protein JWN46_1905 [Acidimicrobiales bacterium]|nr:hypothetical protein [Acidimicrobiales bacterium]
MTALALALAGGYGVHLVWTAEARGWQGLGPGPRVERRTRAASRLRAWLVQAGLDEVQPVEFVAVMVAVFTVGASLAFTLFGGIVPAVVVGVSAASTPIASYRARRRARRARAQEAWPRIIEEIRLLTGSLGRSIPQALFEAGGHAPDALRGGFDAAEREWLISTDFARTVAVLKARLADPTADAACETLLVAHEVGGSDLDRRLGALVEDRIQDSQGRKDARARQAGVRFARRFVLIVPLGMALVGMSVGNGRAAYRTAAGHAAILVGLGLVVLCWLWAGRVMRVPDEQRVFLR